MIYLDTHVAIALGTTRLRGYGREAQRLVDREPDVRISPAVILELELLAEIQRLRVSVDVILAALTGEFGLRVCDQPFEKVARQAAKEGWTRDPFDRMIVAQARLADAPLITLDGRIHANFPRALG